MPIPGPQCRPPESENPGDGPGTVTKQATRAADANSSWSLRTSSAGPPAGLGLWGERGACVVSSLGISHLLTSDKSEPQLSDG